MSFSQFLYNAILNPRQAEIPEEAVLQMLRAHIVKRYGSHKAFAESLGITSTAVSHVLSGRNPPPQAWLDLIHVTRHKTVRYTLDTPPKQ